MICTYCKKKITNIKKAKVFYGDHQVRQAYKKNITDISMIFCSKCLQFMETYFNSQKSNTVKMMQHRLNNQSIYINMLYKELGILDNQKQIKKYLKLLKNVKSKV